MVVRPGFEEGVEEEEARAGEAERLLEDENGRAASVGACLLVPMPCGMWTVVAWWGRWGPTVRLVCRWFHVHIHRMLERHVFMLGSIIRSC